MTATAPQLSAGLVPFRGFYGKYAYRVVTAGGRVFNGTVEMKAAGGPSQAVTVRLPL